jgi:hypothetical protein
VREANVERFQRGDFPRMSIVNVCHSARAVQQALGRVNRAFNKNDKPNFNDNNSRVIIANIQAGGIGIGLHHLLGLPSIQKLPFAENTIEESACRAVERKSANISLLNDDDITAGLVLLHKDEQKELVAA